MWSQRELPAGSAQFERSERVLLSIVKRAILHPRYCSQGHIYRNRGGQPMLFVGKGVFTFSSPISSIYVWKMLQRSAPLVVLCSISFIALIKTETTLGNIFATD